MTDNKPRLARLTAIITQLQSKRVVTAREIAEKHKVSVRTIYRDIQTLEQSGVPVITEEGKGYTIMDGYSIPPIMFTESEAYALVTAEQLILKNKDASFIEDFTGATAKVKAVLKHSVREKADLLKERIIVRLKQTQEISSNHVSVLQLALTNSQRVKIEYSDEANHFTNRIIEPFVLYHEGENWILFAYCRLRRDFRAFRLDRIQQLDLLHETFTPQNMTFQQFIKKQYGTPDT